MFDFQHIPHDCAICEHHMDTKAGHEAVLEKVALKAKPQIKFGVKL
jgi:hypothetical protein